MMPGPEKSNLAHSDHLRHQPEHCLAQNASSPPQPSFSSLNSQNGPSAPNEIQQKEAAPEHKVAISAAPFPDPNSPEALRHVVEQQKIEIDQLRAELIALRTGQTAGHPSVDSEPAAILQSAERRAVQVLSNVAGDEAIGIALPALLRGLTDKNDVRNVQDMCRRIVGVDWEMLFCAFYEEVVRARDQLPERVRALECSLPANWHCEPWYLCYVQCMGAGERTPGFDELRAMLPYLRYSLGFRNVCLLPHYESPMGDGGYDVSEFCARKSLGGEEAFERFLDDALELGMRVATDAVFNHTSTEHAWFQKALAGEEKYLAYYVQRNGREKIGEWDRDGDIVCRYRDPDGTITERIVVFPDVDRTHGLWAEINGKTYQFYRSFFPFQVDLNLQNPDVLVELFQILSREVRQGVLGKRMDAIAHWVKKPGTASEGLPESHAVQALLKSFLRHINRRCIVMPEVVREMATVAKYAGVATTVNSAPCPSEGDALLSFEMQAGLREMLYFQTVAPFWKNIFRAPSLPNGATWVNLLEHHDETFMGFFGSEVRVWLAEYIKTHGGCVYKNGMSAGGRLADCLNNNEERIATALFVLYITPGTPLVYAGTEIGARSDAEHAGRAAGQAYETFQKLGVYTVQESCYDPRELQRGRLPRRVFDKAVEDRYAPVRVVRRMNELRREAAWLREGEARPLDSGDVGLLCLGRGVDDSTGRVLCMANLTASERWVGVPVSQAVAFWGMTSIWERTGNWEVGVKFVDEIEGRRLKVESGAGLLKFWLDAYGRAAVKVMFLGDG